MAGPDLEQTKVPQSVGPLSPFGAAPSNGYVNAYGPQKKPQTHRTNVRSLGRMHAEAVNQGPKPTNFKTLKQDLDKAEGAEAKAGVVKRAMKDSKDPQGVVTFALKDSDAGVDRASLMGFLMKDQPDKMAKHIENLPSDLKDFSGLNLQKAAPEALEALPFNLLNVKGASFPALDLRKNAFMHEAHLENTTMPDVKVPANAVVHAAGAKMHQGPAITEEEKLNTVILAKAGAVTDQPLVNSNFVTISMDQAPQAKEDLKQLVGGPKPELMTPFSSAPSFA